MSFSELIRSEEELLQRLLVVSQRQLEIVELGNSSLLVQHLTRRERLWNEFELLEQKLTPFKGIPAEKRVWESADERLLTESALNHCKTLLEEIMANDQISLEKAAELKDKAEKDMRRVQLSRNVVPAYAKQSQLQQ
jgi:hypothetical protein